jgi:hypothetical protein
VRYRVEFRYREDTGDVEMLQVEVVEGPAGRAPDHDAQHDWVTAEIASVLEPDAEIEEVGPERPVPVPGRPVDPRRTDDASGQRELPPQAG